MKLKYFAYLFLITLSISSVLAAEQSGGPFPNIWSGGWFVNICKIIFGAEAPCTLGTDMILIFFVWLILFVGFGDILKLSMFSENVCWILAFSISVIAANLGLVNKIMIMLTGFLAGIGIASIYVAIGLSFIIFLVFHIALGSYILPWIWRLRGYKKTKKGAIAARSAIEGLKEIKKGFE